MMKLLYIGWKDLLVTFRDRAALIMMLVAPFALTLGMGLVTGGFSDNEGSGLRDIPVVVVNQDEGELGTFLLDALTAEPLADLLLVETAVSPADARQQVEDDSVAAAVLVPPTFSTSIIPNSETGETSELATIEIYANPGRPISASVVEAIVAGFLNQVQTGVLTAEVTVQQLLTSELVDPQALGEIATILGEQVGGENAGAETAVIEVNSYVATDESAGDDFNVLAFFAPGMAIFFLMYTVTLGARSILQEREEGTFLRLLATPTTMAQMLGGKVLGTFLTGLVQVAILIVSTTLLFGLRWGDALGVTALIILVSLASTGWGIVFASVARTSQQVSTMGTAVMLIFGVLGGTFFPATQFAGPLELLSKLTPHVWAMDGFITLATGGTLADIGLAMGALALMAVILFAVATFLLQRRSLSPA